MTLNYMILTGQIKYMSLGDLGCVHTCIYVVESLNIHVGITCMYMHIVSTKGYFTLGVQNVHYYYYYYSDTTNFNKHRWQAELTSLTQRDTGQQWEQCIVSVVLSELLV